MTSLTSRFAMYSTGNNTMNKKEEEKDKKADIKAKPKKIFRDDFLKK